MSTSTDPSHGSDGDARAAEPAEAEAGPGARGAPGLLGRVPKLGVLVVELRGVVIAGVIVFGALAAVSEIVLPMTFAAVLAVVFRPFLGTLQRRGLKPSLAAGLLVLGLLVLMVGVVVATARGVIDQADEIGDSTTAALQEAAKQTDALGIDQEALDTARAAVEDAAPMITTGVLAGLVSGLGAVVAVASGLILGALIMYYLLKDGTRLRRSLVAEVDPRTATRSTPSSATPAASCATTGGAAPPCRASWPSSSASPPSSSACRSCSRSWWSTSSAATSPTSAPSSAAAWP